MPARVTQVYPGATQSGKFYRVRYSVDSDYDTGLVGSLEVTGPGPTFAPATDFNDNPAPPTATQGSAGVPS
jgi:hypothetical protein